MSTILPEGWLHTVAPNGVEILDWPKHGSVSIDYAKRCYELGYTHLVRARSQREVYSGRHWRTNLWNDAIAALKAVYED